MVMAYELTHNKEGKLWGCVCVNKYVYHYRERMKKRKNNKNNNHLKSCSVVYINSLKTKARVYVKGTHIQFLELFADVWSWWQDPVL